MGPIEKLQEYANSASPKTEYVGGRRYYDLGEQKYPSVTTVIHAMSDKTALNEWRERVGAEEARRISNESAVRGTHYHKLIEQHFCGVEDPFSDNPTALKLYQKTKTFLKRFEPIAIECFLYSHTLRVAGRCDFIGYYDGEIAILDLKTSLKEKKKEWMENYFIQECMYALMVYEMFGLPCRSLVTLIANESGFPQLFKERTKDYVQKAVNIVHRYHSIDVSPTFASEWA